MATRADMDLQRLIIETRTVVTGAVSLYMPVKDGAADHQVQPTTDGVGMIGVVIALGTLSGAIGDLVQIAYLAGAGVIKIKVGTGGATRGLPQKVVATGFTDGTTGTEIGGFATQSGAAGDIIGLVPARYKLP
jgi:hypothetical protein